MTADNLVAVPDVPFNRPAVEGNELAYVRAAIEGGHTSSSGEFSVEAGDALREEIGAEEVLLTTSCTAALEMTALLLDLGPGDTVVVPSFAFVTTALAFVRQGARLLFCDIERDTLGLDPGHLADADRRLGARRRAGPLRGRRLRRRRHPQVLGGPAGRGSHRGQRARSVRHASAAQPLGSFGRFATLSFHETKNFICGEGGALVVNDAARRRPGATSLYDKGTNRRAFLLGQVDKYSWQDTGSSFGLSTCSPRTSTASWSSARTIPRKRRAVFEPLPADARAGVADELSAAAARRARRLRAGVPHVLRAAARPATRDRVLVEMREQGVHATFHYVPLHSSARGAGSRPGRPSAR